MLAQVFGEKHLFGSGLIFVLVAIFLWMIKPSQNITKQQRNLLYLFTILFLGFEMIRLIFLIQRDGGLAIYQLPLNLCSVPLYLYPSLSISNQYPWLKKGLMPAAFSTVMLAGLIALLIPSNILGVSNSWFPLSENYVEIASFSYHGLMMLAPLALIKVRYYQPSMKDIPNALGFTGIFAIVAMIVNHFTNQDFLLLNYGTGSPFQFLLGTSKLLYQFVMIALGAILISLFFVIGKPRHKKEA